jgi:Amiloride-sensitive sodium channel
LQKCGCVASQFVFTEEQLLSVNDKVCGNQTSANISSGNISDLTELDGFRDLACSHDVTVDFDECQRQCPNPCVENIYDVSVSTSGSWPDPRFQMAFYSDFIEDSWFADKFTDYQNIEDKLENGSLSPVSIFFEFSLRC